MTEFIELNSHQPLVERLDLAVARKGICTLLGPFGCGKSWLIDYWLRIRKRNTDTIQPGQALYVKLRPEPENRFPMVCMVYARLWHRLQRLEQPTYLTREQEWLEGSDADIKILNSRQLQERLLKLIDKANRRNIRAVIIDDAHFIDKLALEWLMDFRMYYDEKHGFVPRRAIILVGRSDLPEGTRLLKNLEKIDEAVPAWKNLRIEMEHMSRIEFFQAFAQLMKRDLHAAFQPDLGPKEQQREVIELWKGAGGTLDKKDTGEIIERTGARWRAIEELAVDLDEALGRQDGKNPRIITREILARVKSRWVLGAEQNMR